MTREPATSAEPAPSTPASDRAKPLTRHRPAVGTPPDLVPARMINEVLYCERLLYLEWAQGEFADNAFTVEGRAVHRRTDDARGKLPPQPAISTEPVAAHTRASEPGEPIAPAGGASEAGIDGEPSEADSATEASEAGIDGAASEADIAAEARAAVERAAAARAAETEAADPAAAATAAAADEAPRPEPRPYEARSLWLSSERLGITGKVDVVEGTESGSVVPIEYKRGMAPDVPDGAYEPELAQIGAQALLLRDHGYRCDEGAIYFAASRKRVVIPISEELVARTLKAAGRAREVVALGTPPPPLVDSPKCNGCSLVGICLPDETNLLRGLEEAPLVEFEDLPAAPDDGSDTPESILETGDSKTWDPLGPQPDPKKSLRRLHPARDDKVPLYVQENGAYVTLLGERLVVKSKRKDKRPALEARLPNTSQLALFGNVQLTTPALRTLVERGIPVSFFTYGGWYYARTTGFDHKNIELRIVQHEAAADSAFCLKLARGLVASKIRNCRTLLRRNHRAPDAVVLSELEQLAKKAEATEALESLLGIEGSAARTYFGAFTGMLKGEAALGAFDLDGRNRRPPRDPINALLSFLYSLLTKEFTVTLGIVGLDPMLGFYHQPRFGRPALALDLMEEYRPLVADSVAIGVLNNGTIRVNDFIIHPSGVALKPGARKALLLAYERRMDQLVTHPVFGYRISYRRVIEVQARLLGRLLLGEIDQYPAFRTR